MMMEVLWNHWELMILWKRRKLSSIQLRRSLSEDRNRQVSLLNLSHNLGICLDIVRVDRDNGDTQKLEWPPGPDGRLVPWKSGVTVR